MFEENVSVDKLRLLMGTKLTKSYFLSRSPSHTMQWAGSIDQYIIYHEATPEEYNTSVTQDESHHDWNYYRRYQTVYHQTGGQVFCCSIYIMLTSELIHETTLL